MTIMECCANRENLVELRNAIAANQSDVARIFNGQEVNVPTEALDEACSKIIEDKRSYSKRKY